jgi:hypothetical protein
LIDSGVRAAIQMTPCAGGGSAFGALAIAARCLYNSPQQIFLSRHGIASESRSLIFKEIFLDEDTSF